MIIVEKNPGQKIDYEVNKTKLTFDDDLTLNLAKREEDYACQRGGRRCRR